MSEPILPIVNALNAPFWAAAERGVLMLPRCRTSGRPFWPPSPVSPFVTAGPVEWHPVAPSGRVVAGATYRRPFQKAFADALPYAIHLVELDAGPRLLAHVPNTDASDAPRRGDRVHLSFRRLLAEGAPVLVAERAEVEGVT